MDVHPHEVLQGGETQIGQSKPSQHWLEKNKVKTNIKDPTADERIQSTIEDTDLNQKVIG